MSAGLTAQRVYDYLSHAIASGHYPPGSHLEPARIADDCASSTTPVRDALNRLVGERRVEVRPSNGFHVPLLTEIGLRDLYRWNDHLCRAALRELRFDTIHADIVSIPQDTAGLFTVIAAASRSVEVRHQMATANFRLAIARQVEPEVLGDPQMDIEAILSAMSTGVDRTRKLLSTYHKIRFRAVPQIISVFLQRVNEM